MVLGIAGGPDLVGFIKVNELEPTVLDPPLDDLFKILPKLNTFDLILVKV